MRASLCCCAVASLLCGCGGAGGQSVPKGVTKTAAAATALPSTPVAPDAHHRWKPHCRGGWKNEQCQWVLKLTDNGFGTQVQVTDKQGHFVAAWLEPGQGDPATFHGNDLHSLDDAQPLQTDVLFFQLTPSGAILTRDVDGVVRVLHGRKAVVAPVPNVSFITLSDDGMSVFYSDNGGVWETDLVEVSPHNRQFSNPRLLGPPPSGFLFEFFANGFLWGDQTGVFLNYVPTIPTTHISSGFFGDSSQLVWTEQFLRVMSATSSDGGQTWSAPVQVDKGRTFPTGEVYNPRVANGLVVWGEAVEGFGRVHTSDGRLFDAAGPDVSTFCGTTIVFSAPYTDPFTDPRFQDDNPFITVVSGQEAPVTLDRQGLHPHIDNWGHVWWNNGIGGSGGNPGELDVVQLACSQ